MSLPLEPCTLTASKGVNDAVALARRVDDRLPRAPNVRVACELASALTDIRSQVVDNSGGYTQVILEGANALDVLQHVSVYDFASMEPGRVVGTTFGKSSVYAFRQGEGYPPGRSAAVSPTTFGAISCALPSPYGLGIAEIRQAVSEPASAP